MEYFKVVEKERDAILEVNRENSGDFLFKAHEINADCWIKLSKTEAKDLADFIIKRLSEEQPQEINSF